MFLPAVSRRYTSLIPWPLKDVWEHRIQQFNQVLEALVLTWDNAVLMDLDFLLKADLLHVNGFHFNEQAHIAYAHCLLSFCEAHQFLYEHGLILVTEE